MTRSSPVIVAKSKKSGHERLLGHIFILRRIVAADQSFVRSVKETVRTSCTHEQVRAFRCLFRSNLNCDNIAHVQIAPKRLFFVLLLTPFVVVAFARQDLPDEVPGEVIVGVPISKTEQSFNKPAETGLLAVAGKLGRIRASYPEIGIKIISLRAGISEGDAEAALLKSPDVSFVQPNYIYRVVATPNDPKFGDARQYGLRLAGVQQAWGSWRPLRKATIALVDTGIDGSHPDLQNKVLPGYNAIDLSANTADDNGHGTHCAGIAGAQTNNGIGISGVCGWNGKPGSDTLETKLLPVKAFNAAGRGTTVDVSLGLNWAYQHGADVISMSFTFPVPDTTFNNVIQRAWNRGCVLVAAAGNAGSTSLDYPAAYQHVVSVAATDPTDTLTDFSTYGNWVSVAAPGFDILSTYPHNSYVALSGTSMAAPFVAGIAALIRSQYPAISNSEIVSSILESTDACKASPSGHTLAYGVGRVNAERALLAPGSPNGPIGRNSDGTMELFARGRTGEIWTIKQAIPNSAWGAWTSLGGTVAGNPVVGSNADGRLQLFVRGGDNALYSKYELQQNGNWSAWYGVNANLLGDIAIQRNKDGRMQAFARTVDKNIVSMWQNTPNSSWSGWRDLGGVFDSEPSASFNEDGRLQVFAQGGGPGIYYSYLLWPSWQWTGWSYSGGALLQPWAARNPDGRMQVFARAPDGSIWNAWQAVPNSYWSSWFKTGNQVAADSGPVATLDGRSRLQVFMRGTDHAIWTLRQDLTTWISLGGYVGGDPIVSRNEDGRIQLFVVGTNGVMYSKYERDYDGNWSDWFALGDGVSRF